MSPAAARISSLFGAGGLTGGWSMGQGGGREGADPGYAGAAPRTAPLPSDRGGPYRRRRGTRMAPLRDLGPLAARSAAAEGNACRRATASDAGAAPRGSAAGPPKDGAPPSSRRVGRTAPLADRGLLAEDCCEARRNEVDALSTGAGAAPCGSRETCRSLLRKLGGSGSGWSEDETRSSQHAIIIGPAPRRGGARRRGESSPPSSPRAKRSQPLRDPGRLAARWTENGRAGPEPAASDGAGALVHQAPVPLAGRGAPQIGRVAAGARSHRRPGRFAAAWAEGERNGSGRSAARRAGPAPRGRSRRLGARVARLSSWRARREPSPRYCRPLAGCAVSSGAGTERVCSDATPAVRARAGGFPHDRTGPVP